METETSKYSSAIILVENLRLTGGIRQSLKLLEDIVLPSEIYFGLTARRTCGIRSLFGFIKDYFIAQINKPAIAKIIFIKKPITIKLSTIYITTSRDTLLYVNNLGASNHIHYCQHIELWDFINSQKFLKFCESEGYPNSKKFFKLLLNNLNTLSSKELSYLENLKAIKNFYTVSDFLSNLLQELNQNIPNIKLISVKPHIFKTIETSIRKYDLMFFLRGIPFKGDEIIIELLHFFSKLQFINILVICNSARALKAFAHLKCSNITSVINPSDIDLAKYYTNSKIVVCTSLLEGFGSIPQEALSMGCKVVSSRTGWLCNHKDITENIHVIDYHNKNHYVEKIISFL